MNNSSDKAGIDLSGRVELDASQRKEVLDFIAESDHKIDSILEENDKKRLTFGYVKEVIAQIAKILSEEEERARPLIDDEILVTKIHQKINNIGQVWVNYGSKTNLKDGHKISDLVPKLRTALKGETIVDRRSKPRGSGRASVEEATIINLDNANMKKSAGSDVGFSMGAALDAAGVDKIVETTGANLEGNSEPIDYEKYFAKVGLLGDLKDYLVKLKSLDGDLPIEGDKVKILDGMLKSLNNLFNFVKIEGISYEITVAELDRFLEMAPDLFDYKTALGKVFNKFLDFKKQQEGKSKTEDLEEGVEKNDEYFSGAKTTEELVDYLEGLIKQPLKLTELKVKEGDIKKEISGLKTFFYNMSKPEKSVEEATKIFNGRFLPNTPDYFDYRDAVKRIFANFISLKREDALKSKTTKPAGPVGNKPKDAAPVAEASTTTESVEDNTNDPFFNVKNLDDFLKVLTDIKNYPGKLEAISGDKAQAIDYEISLLEKFFKNVEQEDVSIDSAKRRFENYILKAPKIPGYSEALKNIFANFIKIVKEPQQAPAGKKENSKSIPKAAKTGTPANNKNTPPVNNADAGRKAELVIVKEEPTSNIEVRQKSQRDFRFDNFNLNELLDDVEFKSYLLGFSDTKDVISNEEEMHKRYDTFVKQRKVSDSIKKLLADKVEKLEIALSEEDLLEIDREMLERAYKSPTEIDKYYEQVTVFGQDVTEKLAGLERDILKEFGPNGDKKDRVLYSQKAKRDNLQDLVDLLKNGDHQQLKLMGIDVYGEAKETLKKQGQSSDTRVSSLLNFLSFGKIKTSENKNFKEQVKTVIDDRIKELQKQIEKVTKNINFIEKGGYELAVSVLKDQYGEVFNRIAGDVLGMGNIKKIIEDKVSNKLKKFIETNKISASDYLEKVLLYRHILPGGINLLDDKGQTINTEDVRLKIDDLLTKAAFDKMDEQMSQITKEHNLSGFIKVVNDILTVERIGSMKTQIEIIRILSARLKEKINEEKDEWTKILYTKALSDVLKEKGNYAERGAVPPVLNNQI